MAAAFLAGAHEELSSTAKQLGVTLRRLDEIETRDRERDRLVEEIRCLSYDVEDLMDELDLNPKKQSARNSRGLFRNILKLIKHRRAGIRVILALKMLQPVLRDKLECTRKYLDMLNAPERCIHGHHDGAMSDDRGDSVLIWKGDLIGVDRRMGYLFPWLLEGGFGYRLKVLSIVGMGGLGKTALAATIYKDRGMLTRFEKRAWVNVSTAFQAKELLLDLVRQLSGSPVPANLNYMELKELIQDVLRGKRFLMVLDDIWDEGFWNIIKHALRCCCQGSCVILTTRNADFNLSMSSDLDVKVYNLEPLSLEESWDLFCQKALRGEKCPHYMEEVGQLILKWCEGLPLAVLAICGVLGKNMTRIEEWHKLYQSLCVDVDLDYRLQSMTKVLSPSYLNLPVYLKPCFLYLRLFPEDCLVDRNRLVRLWIAEGFISQRGSRTLEDVADGYFQELLDRSLIQPVDRRSDGRVLTCRLHNLMRKLIILECSHLNIVTTDFAEITALPKRVRRLSVHGQSGNFREEILSQLRSLFIFGGSPLPFGWKALTLSRLLRVFDLACAPLIKAPDSVFTMIHLRYLSLRDTKVRKIPRSIGKLVNLETLDLKGSLVTELPPEFAQLVRIRHILVYHHEEDSVLQHHHMKGFKVAFPIGGLSHLQKLCFIESDKCVLEELAKLTQLGRLGVTGLRTEYGERLCSSLSKLQNLRSLNIHAVAEDEIISLQALSSPPQFLQRIYLHGRLEELPHWIPSLYGLTKIVLRWSKLEKGLAESLGSLPNLIELQLLKAYDGKKLYFGSGQFPRLKILLLDELEALKLLIMENGVMPCLETLTISNCHWLEEVPSGIEHLPKLQVLQFFNVSYKLQDMLQADKKDGDYKKIQHIPNVYIARLKEGHDVSMGSGSAEKEVAFGPVQEFKC